MNPTAFIAKIAPAAVADMRKTRIPASLTIAQAILESAWGESGLTKKANNLFGIKGLGPAGSVSMPTTEYIGRKQVPILSRFRAYHSWDESISDHSALLINGTKDKPARYHGVLGANYQTACQEIWKAGYATDPAYPHKLVALVEQYDLAAYDACDLPLPAQDFNRKAAEKIIAELGEIWTANSSDKEVRAAAHFAADALRDAVGIPR